ncbi:helix-turn-helix domain-containing protein [Nocardia stercoris]|uniref:helix-turn-helix domain-containing protein n=1 Tax=Nocardia stercoris TaxID=2483361 RepID=UPI0038995B30
MRPVGADSTCTFAGCGWGTKSNGGVGRSRPPIFRAETGCSPLQWLLDQRIDRARELLEITGLSIPEVARRAGTQIPLSHKRSHPSDPKRVLLPAGSCGHAARIGGRLPPWEQTDPLPGLDERLQGMALAFPA